MATNWEKMVATIRTIKPRVTPNITLGEPAFIDPKTGEMAIRMTNMEFSTAPRKMYGRRRPHLEVL